MNSAEMERAPAEVVTQLLWPSTVEPVTRLLLHACATCSGDAIESRIRSNMWRGDNAAAREDMRAASRTVWTDAASMNIESTRQVRLAPIDPTLPRVSWCLASGVACTASSLSTTLSRRSKERVRERERGRVAAWRVRRILRSAALAATVAHKGERRVGVTKARRRFQPKLASTLRSLVSLALSLTVHRCYSHSPDAAAAIDRTVSLCLSLSRPTKTEANVALRAAMVAATTIPLYITVPLSAMQHLSQQASQPPPSPTGLLPVFTTHHGVDTWTAVALSLALIHSGSSSVTTPLTAIGDTAPGLPSRWLTLDLDGAETPASVERARADRRERDRDSISAMPLDEWTHRHLPQRGVDSLLPPGLLDSLPPILADRLSVSLALSCSPSLRHFTLVGDVGCHWITTWRCLGAPRQASAYGASLVRASLAATPPHPISPSPPHSHYLALITAQVQPFAHSAGSGASNSLSQSQPNRASATQSMSQAAHGSAHPASSAPSPLALASVVFTEWLERTPGHPVALSHLLQLSLALSLPLSNVLHLTLTLAGTDTSSDLAYHTLATTLEVYGPRGDPTRSDRLPVCGLSLVSLALARLSVHPDRPSSWWFMLRAVTWPTAPRAQTSTWLAHLWLLAQLWDDSDMPTALPEPGVLLNLLLPRLLLPLTIAAYLPRTIRPMTSHFRRKLTRLLAETSDEVKARVEQVEAEIEEQLARWQEQEHEPDPESEKEDEEEPDDEPDAAAASAPVHEAGSTRGFDGPLSGAGGAGSDDDESDGDIAMAAVE
uniref:Uncharacterized protein n=1 Tax=Sexangularia sp. CB-2014 TaxID=1486929 RepID=A0A7S1VP15_9EUKA